MKQRIITGLIAGIIFLILLFLGNFYIYLSVFLLAIIGMHELIKMRNNFIYSPSSMYAMFLVALIFGQGLFMYQFFSPAGIILTLIIALIIPVLTKNHTTFEDMAFAFFSSIYVGIGFYSLVMVRLDTSFLFTVMVLLAIWATDSGAYFTGYVFKGKGPKLWESISPKKTVVGAIGGTIASIIIILVMQNFLNESINLAQQFLLGVSIAVIGQIGDLAQSAYKRFYKVKDSGNILPGHGGILDRFDSMLFVFPIVYIITLYI